MGNGRLEFACTVTCVVVHLGQVLNELGFRFGVSAPPVFIGHTISIVVFSIDVVLIDLPVTIVIGVVNRPVVDIVILACIASTWEQWASGAKRGAPFELIIAVEVDAVTSFINRFIQIRNRCNARHGVVTEVLSPTSR